MLATYLCRTVLTSFTPEKTEREKETENKPEQVSGVGIIQEKCICCCHILLLLPLPRLLLLAALTRAADRSRAILHSHVLLFLSYLFNTNYHSVGQTEMMPFFPTKGLVIQECITKKKLLIRFDLLNKTASRLQKTSPIFCTIYFI